MYNTNNNINNMTLIIIIIAPPPPPSGADHCWRLPLLPRRGVATPRSRGTVPCVRCGAGPLGLTILYGRQLIMKLIRLVPQGSVLFLRALKQGF